MATQQNLSQSFEGNTNENRDSRTFRITIASSSYLPKLKQALHRRLLTYLMVLACLLGVCVGILLRLRKEPYTERERIHMRFPGEIMVNMLNLLVLPLVVSSIISGISLEDTWAVGKISLRTFGYFLFTYILSSMLGVLFAISIFPTSKHASKHERAAKIQITVMDSVLNIIRNMFPPNMIVATFQSTFTALKEKKISKAVANPPALADHATNLTTMATSNTELVKEVKIIPGINMLGIIVMSIAGGIVINRLGDKGLPLKIFFDAVFEITMVLIGIVNWYTPVGVFFLVVESVVATDTSKDVPRQASFVIAVIAALLMHSVFILPFISFVICRRNPYIFINNIMNVLITAVGTSSSLATLPFLVKSLEHRKMKLDRRTVGFVAPIGSSINMDGSAIFTTIAVIFLGKLQGVEFDFLKILSVGFMAIATAISAAGVPQGGLAAVKVLTETIGVVDPRTDYLVPLDWIVDRFVTSTNVLSDAFGCVVVHHLTRPRRRRRHKSVSDDEYNSTFSSESSYHSEETNPQRAMSTGATNSTL